MTKEGHSCGKCSPKKDIKHLHKKDLENLKEYRERYLIAEEEVLHLSALLAMPDKAIWKTVGDLMDRVNEKNILLNKIKTLCNEPRVNPDDILKLFEK